MTMAMSTSFKVKVVDECKLAPPTDSVPDSYALLPLTFLDIPWLLFPPSKTLFFFQLPQESQPPPCFFATDVVPKLKLSLSSALQHFFPFAGRLTLRDDNDSVSIYCSSDSHDCTTVSLIVAECDGDFSHLCGDHQRDASVFHQLVPHFETATTTSKRPGSLLSFAAEPLLAIQITYFPKEAGFSIGLTCHHVVCDQRTLNNFIHCWASLCKFDRKPDGLQPDFDRSVIIDPNGLKSILMKHLLESIPSTNNTNAYKGMVRATFVMGPTDIENAKRWVLAECVKNNRAEPVLLSTYVVACAFVWAFLVRAQQDGPVQYRGAKGSKYFGFIAGGITRLPYRVPVNYFGNCVGFGRAVVNGEELLSEDGILAAVDAIGRTIKDLDAYILGGAEKWISDWEAIIGSDLHINVVGSPKVDLYETDFGWGMPKKIEEISIDAMRGISLVESRNLKGGIEIGLTQPKSTMDAFSSLFTQGHVSLGS